MLEISVALQRYLLFHPSLSLLLSPFLTLPSVLPFFLLTSGCSDVLFSELSQIHVTHFFLGLLV